MPSEGPHTVPGMGSFKRGFLGYRRHEVDAAISARDLHLAALQEDTDRTLGRWRGVAERSEGELVALSAMVIEREGEIRSLSERLQEANERHDRSIASLEAVSARLQEIQTQARGQATRIRMKALREAVEVSRRVQELSEAHPGAASASSNGKTARRRRWGSRRRLTPLKDW